MIAHFSLDFAGLVNSHYASTGGLSTELLASDWINLVVAAIGIVTALVLISQKNYPELENGQIAKVTADIKINEGGVAGYTGNYFITDLKDQTVMSYEEVTDDLSISEAAAEEEMSYGNKLLQYRQNDDLYFIVQIGQNVDVYLNGESVMEYEWSDPDNILEPFFEEITV
ncbi:MAG: hypothetical protein K6E90_02900 [Lachnospiraceae bacterium]|nr:hypothetical protein [Lachnospiraceae bacterium]